MIEVRNRNQKILPDSFIYGQGTSWRYLRIYFQDESGEKIYITVTCPPHLPTEVLRATRTAILQRVEENKERWTLKDVRKLELTARDAVHKIGQERKNKT